MTRRSMFLGDVPNVSSISRSALMTFRDLHIGNIPTMRATYLVSGIVPPFQTITTGKFGEEPKDTNAMDEVLVPRFRMTVVEEHALNGSSSCD